MDRTAGSTKPLDPRLYRGLSSGIQSARAFPYEEGDVFGVSLVGPELVWEVDGVSVGDKEW